MVTVSGCNPPFRLRVVQNCLKTMNMRCCTEYSVLRTFNRLELSKVSVSRVPRDRTTRPSIYKMAVHSYVDLRVLDAWLLHKFHCDCLKVEGTNDFIATAD